MVCRCVSSSRFCKKGIAFFLSARNKLCLRHSILNIHTAWFWEKKALRAFAASGTTHTSQRNISENLNPKQNRCENLSLRWINPHTFPYITYGNINAFFHIYCYDFPAVFYTFETSRISGLSHMQSRLVPHHLTFWRRTFFLNFSTPCI